MSAHCSSVPHHVRIQPGRGPSPRRHPDLRLQLWEINCSAYSPLGLWYFCYGSWSWLRQSPGKLLQPALPSQFPGLTTWLSLCPSLWFWILCSILRGELEFIRETLQPWLLGLPCGSECPASAQTTCAQIRQSRVLLKPKILIQKYLYNADYLCSISALQIMTYENWYKRKILGLCNRNGKWFPQQL